jgi:hypothetical protein
LIQAADGGGLLHRKDVNLFFSLTRTQNTPESIVGFLFREEMTGVPSLLNKGTGKILVI